MEATKTSIMDEDVLTGFSMFSAIMYCPESTLKLYQFLHGLLSTQSPRTIIQATVNTIQSDEIKENRIHLNQFYLALDKVFHFELGKILLATASSSELESMIAADWPYFSHNPQEVKQCLRGSGCSLIQSLGRH